MLIDFQTFVQQVLSNRDAPSIFPKKKAFPQLVAKIVLFPLPSTIHYHYYVMIGVINIYYEQGWIKAGADGAAAPGPPKNRPITIPSQ